MGEVLRKIGKVNLLGVDTEVELNISSVPFNEDVHVQNANFRYEFTKEDFLRLLGVIWEAERQLRWIKNKER